MWINLLRSCLSASPLLFLLCRDWQSWGSHFQVTPSKGACKQSGTGWPRSCFWGVRIDCGGRTQEHRSQRRGWGRVMEPLRTAPLQGVCGPWEPWGGPHLPREQWGLVWLCFGVYPLTPAPLHPHLSEPAAPRPAQPHLQELVGKAESQCPSPAQPEYAFLQAPQGVDCSGRWAFILLAFCTSP